MDESGAEKRIVVMASGGGTNLQALINAAEAGYLGGKIVAVIVNRKAAYALTRAEKHAIPAVYFPLKPYTESGKSREDYDADLADCVAQFSPDLIVFAGWMHITSPVFIDRFQGCIINLHPALPGQFAGANAVVRSFEAYRRGEVDSGGCMVHIVVPELDAGPLIAAAEVPFLHGEDLAAFERRLHAAEHQLIVQATRMMCSVKLRAPD